MSIEINAKLICDGCGAHVHGQPEYRSTRMESPLWEAKHLAKAQGWTSVNRGRFLPRAHYCKDCADKPQSPIPKKSPAKRFHTGKYEPDF